MHLKLFLAWVATSSVLYAFPQNLNWNSVSYTTGSLSANFGSIGSPASTVSLSITGNTSRIQAGFPVKYIADPAGTPNDCAVNCALRSSVTFVTPGESVVYTFSFSPAVSGLSFRIYDIDGTDASSGDQATVSSSKNITITCSGGSGGSCPTITGSGTTAATARGTQGNTTDDFSDVSITGAVSSVSVTYANNVNNPTAGNRSFSIGNMNWSGVLPVKWVSFSGKKQVNGSILLKWITENEVNTDKFTVERSKDGLHYTGLADQPALGGSNRNTYVFADAAPGNGNTFYRIKQSDLDGRFEYSNIVLIKENNAGNDPVLFPNPAGGFINLVLPGNVQLKQVQVADAAGRILIRSADGKNRLNVSRLTPGLYILLTEDSGGEVYRKTFIKL